MNIIHAPWPPEPPPPLDLPGRLEQVLDNLIKAAAAHASRNWVMAPLVMLLGPYLRRVLRRFASLSARLRAGPIVTRPARPRPAKTAEHEMESVRKARLPGSFGWLLRMLRHEAAGVGLQLRHMLTNDPEMVALMAAAPGQAGRIFRPLCRMLGMEPGIDLPASIYPPGTAPRIPKARSAPGPDTPQNSPECSRARRSSGRSEARHEAPAAQQAVTNPWGHSAGRPRPLGQWSARKDSSSQGWNLQPRREGRDGFGGWPMVKRRRGGLSLL